MAKKVNEMTMASGGSVAGFDIDNKKLKRETKVKDAFTPAHAAVYEKETEVNPQFDPSLPPNSKNRRLKRKGKKKMKSYTLAVAETKAESMLRETIRDLIMLNKVKFYEEQAKQAIQENKLRYVIRQLLAEKSERVYDTTGQNKGADGFAKIKLTFDDYTDLTSSTKEREAFKVAYISGLRAILDSEDKSNQVIPAGQTTAPAKRRDIDEQEATESDMETPSLPPEASTPASAAPEDLVKQTATQAATAAVGVKDAASAPNEIQSAIEALTRDAPQIVALYRQLSDKTITVNGRTTTDKKDFRQFLIGDGQNAGNIQIEFDKRDKLSPASDAVQTPETKPVVTSAEKPAQEPTLSAAPETTEPSAGTTPEELAAEV
jgi:hypothetical protein